MGQPIIILKSHLLLFFHNYEHMYMSYRQLVFSIGQLFLELSDKIKPVCLTVIMSLYDT